MCHWKKWIWPGILTVAILSALALWMKSDFIEQDLAGKAAAALSGQGQNWASVEMDGRDATVLGSAPNEEARAKAGASALGAYDVRIVNNKSELIAAQSPYVLNAKLDGDTVELTGFVPDDDVRKTIVTAAIEALPGNTVKDNMTLARGAPEGLAAMAGFGFTQLKGLLKGEMSLSNSDLTVKGAARDLASYTAITTALDGALPGGAKLAMKEIIAPAASPYTWSANYDGNRLALSGFVPSVDVAASVVAKAKAALPNAEIIDQQKIASGQPDGFEAAAEFALQQLPRFSQGSVGLTDLDLDVKGVAKSSSNYIGALGALGTASLPAGLALASSDITPATASPYVWSADYDGSAVTLSGFVPNEAVRGEIVAKAQSALDTTSITDNMQIADGAPEAFAGASNFAIDQLPRFSSGFVALENKLLTIRGVSRNVDEHVAATTASTGELPAGMELAMSDITPPAVSPYVWGANYDGQGVVLTGYVPDDATRSAVTDAVQQALPGAAITDNMLVAAGAPNDFVTATSFGAGQLVRFTNGSVSLQDSSLTVKGVAKDSANYTQAKAGVSGLLPAGLTLASEDIVPPTVSPYVWGADYSENAVTLSGFVPNDAARESINAAVEKALPNATVSDKTQIARGAPEGFVNAAGFSADQLTRFSSGTVNLSGRALAIRGTALDSQAYSAARIAISSGLPGDMTLASENIVPPSVSPYVWGADYTGSVVTLSGFVPNDEARGSINAAVNKALPNAAITDNMQIARGAPDGFASAARFSANQLARFSTGTVGLSDRALAIRGAALDSQSYTAAQIAISSGLPGDMTLASGNIVPPTVSPYSWGANYGGDTVTLSGYVPNNEIRENIISETQRRLPDAKIVDQMQIATGAPDGYEAAAASAIAVLPRFSKGNVALSDLNLTVNGTGKSSANYLAAERFVAGDLGNTTLVAANIMPPAAAGDYDWQAQKSGNSIVLSGLAPSKADRIGIAAKTSELYPGTTLVNRMTVETGAPGGFIVNTTKGLMLLDRLSTGTASIKNEQLNIVGTAKTVNDFEAIQTEIAGNLKAGYSWKVRDIKAPVINPYTWTVEKGTSTAVLGGYVPNRGMGNSNIAAAQVTLSRPIEDRQRVAAGEPKEFGNAVAALIVSVNKLEESFGTITNDNVYVQGKAASEAEANRIGDEIGASLPKNYSLRKEISFPPPPKPVPVPEPKPEPVVVEPKPEPAPEPKPEPVVVEPKSEPVVTAPRVCNVNFSALFAGEKIQFDTARAVIKQSSYPLLDRIANGMRQCENSRIEIGGHTDSRGSGSYNRGLSRARAIAVFDYLTRAGIKPDNLVANGYGESQPIAPNKRPRDRIKNRRIEFKVLNQN